MPELIKPHITGQKVGWGRASAALGGGWELLRCRARPPRRCSMICSVAEIRHSSGTLMAAGSDGRGNEARPRQRWAVCGGRGRATTVPGQVPPPLQHDLQRCCEGATARDSVGSIDGRGRCYGALCTGAALGSCCHSSSQLSQQQRQTQPLHNIVRFRLLPPPQGRAPLAARGRVSLVRGCHCGCSRGLALNEVRTFQSRELQNVCRMPTLWVMKTGQNISMQTPRPGSAFCISKCENVS